MLRPTFLPHLPTELRSKDDDDVVAAENIRRHEWQQVLDWMPWSILLPFDD
jgi:hypothetical protein